MAKPFVTSINLNNNELQNVRVQNLATPPAHAAGRIYYDTGLAHFRVSDGASWTDLTAATAGYTDESAQDAIAAAIAAGTATNITITYNDASNSFSYAVAADGAAATPTLRTLGTAATQAAAGNDARLSDTRTPTAGSVVDASVAAGAAIAESKLALASDAAATTASRRTLGTGALQAAAGNDSRLSDARNPIAGSVVDASVSASAAIAESKLALASDAAAGVASRRTLGTGALQAAAGNDARLSDTRTPTAGSVVNASVAVGAAISSDKLADGTTNGVYTLTERTKLAGIATGATANSTDAYLLNRTNHTGTESADVLTDGTTNKAFLATERTKLAGIATGATANSTDAYLLSRANHTGTQLAATISDFTTTVTAFRHDQFAAPTASVSWNSQYLTNLHDPTNPQDAATKNYVDATATGLDVKASVQVATTANITLSGLQTIDGYTTVAGDRVLVKNQTTASANGIYVAAAGAWARSSDADNSGSASEVSSGLFVFVENGTTQATTGWILSTTGAITLNTTSLTFTQFSGAGTYTNGNGLNLTGNSFSVKPSTGIAVSAAGVALDTTVAVRKYAQTIGDGTTTSFAISHGLATQDVTVAVYATASTFDEVIPDVQHTSASITTIIFATAPTANQYRVVIHG